MRRLCFLTVFLSLGGPAVGQVCTILPHPDGQPGPTLVGPRGAVPLEPAFEDYAYMLWDICEAWGDPIQDKCIIYPLMGEIGWNAVAASCDGAERVIVYDRRLSSVVGGDGAEAIIAHELGHHVCGHIGPAAKSISSHAAELEADRFAGASMRKLGHKLEVALSYAPILSELPSSNHPAAPERLAAIEEGWRSPEDALTCFRS